jgi:hypothetical protein
MDSLTQPHTGDINHEQQSLLLDIGSVFYYLYHILSRKYRGEFFGLSRPGNLLYTPRLQQYIFKKLLYCRIIRIDRLPVQSLLIPTDKIRSGYVIIEWLRSIVLLIVIEKVAQYLTIRFYRTR